MLEEALQRLGAQDNPKNSRLTTEILSALARALGVSGQQQQAMVYAQRALTMARRFDDPALVAHSLYGVLLALAEEQAEHRLSVATEMLDLAKAVNETELLIEAHWWQAFCSLESGDMAAAGAEIDTHRRHSEETKAPFCLSINAMFQATLALMLGRFEDSERLAQQALTIGQSAQTETAAGVFGLQMFALRREQGRLKEAKPMVRLFVQQHSAAAAWRPGLAIIYSELGLSAEARAEFEILAQHDFADLPRDAVWMSTMTYLVDICTFLMDRDRARILYQILEPFAGRNVIVGNGAACYGSLSRYLGALATTLERWDDAVRHFEDALAMNARMDARPWLAHSQALYAKMLLARAEPGDREKALALHETALAGARELGMRALEERIIATQTKAKLQ